MSITAGAIAGAIILVVTLATAVDAAIKDGNAKKATKLANQLDATINKYNLSQQQLDDALSKKQLSYNNLMDRLRYVSRASSAHKLKDQADREMDTLTSNTLATKQYNQRKFNAEAANLNTLRSKYENKGII